MCHDKKDIDKIIYIVNNWRPELRIREMDNGYERDHLKKFCHEISSGTKLSKMYHVSTVQPPGGQTHKVLHHLELDKASGNMRPGQIVVSSEEVFNCIHDWHKFSTHMGQERTWNWCREKYYNISQGLVRDYCMTCVACLKKNPSAKSTKGSRKPI